jgi:tetratricopeptide (TPR) repeat protein
MLLVSSAVRSMAVRVARAGEEHGADYVQQQLGAAAAAAQRGDLRAAWDGLQAALAEVDAPELREFAGQLAFVVAEADAGIAHLHAAVGQYEALGQPRRAALAAHALGNMYEAATGNMLMARGWYSRARRYLADEGRCVESGWVALKWTGCDVNDPAELLRDAEYALAVAREFGDRALEAHALADGGLALVSLARRDEGMAWIDEAMTLVTSEPFNLVTRGQVCCNMINACDRTGDLVRLETWSETMQRLDLVGEDAPVALMTIDCDVTYGRSLCQLGRWQEAESTLDTGARRASKSGSKYHQVRVACAMAELRLRQGRLDEAEALLLGLDDRIDAIIPLAQLHLARGDHELACAAARRGIRMLGADRLRIVSLYAVLVEAELGRGDRDAATAAADALVETIADCELPAVCAQAALAVTQATAATGDTDGAIATLERSLEQLAQTELPYLKATLHLELARLHAQRDPAAAAIEARAAAALRAQLDGTADGGTDVELAMASMRQKADQWTVRCNGTAVVLKDTKGLRYLNELVAHPGVERHVLDLVDLVEGVEPGLDRRRLGDAGELLDQQARREYRRRIEALRGEQQEAEVLGNEDRAWAVQEEIDALIGQLAAAVGLGRHERRAGSAVERARLNVTRALRTAIARIEQPLPELGRHLDRSVRTGVFCSYAPAADESVRWS